MRRARHTTELAAQISKGASQDLDRIKRISAWLYNNIDKRPVLGIPDALTTLQNRRGDCNEHAALFAALARNLKIPTRIVAGVTFHQNAFYYHAWNEVCIGGKWLSVDSTKNQIPADISHIKFVEGETSEQVKIAALIGKLSIEVLESCQDSDDASCLLFDAPAVLLSQSQSSAMLNQLRLTGTPNTGAILRHFTLDDLAKSHGMAKHPKGHKLQFRYTRRSNFSGARPYMWYAECLKNYYNAVDRTFCDAISLLTGH